MQLSFLDWSIVIGYLVVALGVGVYFAKRAGKNSEEYFLGGRSLPWWVLGTSMVATTFAADTPLAITEMTRSKGLWENWFLVELASLRFVSRLFIFSSLAASQCAHRK